MELEFVGFVHTANLRRTAGTREAYEHGVRFFFPWFFFGLACSSSKSHVHNWRKAFSIEHESALYFPSHMVSRKANLDVTRYMVCNTSMAAVWDTYGISVTGRDIWIPPSHNKVIRTNSFRRHSSCPILQQTCMTTLGPGTVEVVL
jgi:hypothetical protein